MGNAAIYETPFGPVTMIEKDGFLTDLRLGASYALDYVIRETPLTANAYMQLCQYFRGERRNFDLPMCPGGTAFQKRVWTALLTIPYGETRSYKEIAVQAGNPRAARAVGMANNRNPLLFLIPCHRCVGSDGSLVGYRDGLAIKQRLLELEQNGTALL